MTFNPYLIHQIKPNKKEAKRASFLLGVNIRDFNLALR
jgi:hypothetical protein